MKVNEDPEIDRLRRQITEQGRLLRLATRAVEKGGGLPMREREQVLEQLQEYRL